MVDGDGVHILVTGAQVLEMMWWSSNWSTGAADGDYAFFIRAQVLETVMKF